MLSASQLELYQHVVDIWREAENFDGNGKPLAKSWTKIASAVPCYCNQGKSQQGPMGDLLLAESDNLFTLDEFHMEASVDIGIGDTLKMTTGPTVGKFWTVRGDAQIKSLMANKLSVLCSRTPKKPDGVDP